MVTTPQEVGKFSGSLINQGTPGVPFKRGIAFCQVVTYKPLQSNTDYHTSTAAPAGPRKTPTQSQAPKQQEERAISKAICLHPGQQYKGIDYIQRGNDKYFMFDVRKRNWPTNYHHYHPAFDMVTEEGWVQSGRPLRQGNQGLHNSISSPCSTLTHSY